MRKPSKQTRPQEAKREAKRLYEKPIFPFETSYNKAHALRQSIRENGPDGITFAHCTVKVLSASRIKATLRRCKKGTEPHPDIPIEFDVDPEKTRDVISNLLNERAERIDELERYFGKSERLKKIRDRIERNHKDA